MIRLISAPSSDAVHWLDQCSLKAKELVESKGDPSEVYNNCYRNQKVKASLLLETSEKCAYCESKITHIYWGDIEHLRPKSIFPEKALDYDNLTIACAVCNNKKRGYWNPEAPILNPYEYDPEEHLVGLGPLVWHKNGSQIGQRTVDLIDLNREQLIERREERLQFISNLADRYQREPEGPIKEVLASTLNEAIQDSEEFSLTARSFLTFATGS